MRHQSAKVSNKTVGFNPNPRNGGHTPPYAASVRGHQHQSPPDQGETREESLMPLLCALGHHGALVSIEGMIDERG